MKDLSGRDDIFFLLRDDNAKLEYLSALILLKAFLIYIIGDLSQVCVWITRVRRQANRLRLHVLIRHNNFAHDALACCLIIFSLCMKRHRWKSFSFL